MFLKFKSELGSPFNVYSIVTSTFVDVVVLPFNIFAFILWFFESGAFYCNFYFKVAVGMYLLALEKIYSGAQNLLFVTSKLNLGTSREKLPPFVILRFLNIIVEYVELELVIEIWEWCLASF